MGVVLSNNENHDECPNFYSFETGRVTCSKDVIADETRLGFADCKVDWLRKDVNAAKNKSYSDKDYLPGSGAFDKARSERAHASVRKRGDKSSKFRDAIDYTTDEDEIGVDEGVDTNEGDRIEVEEDSSMGESTSKTRKRKSSNDTQDRDETDVSQRGRKRTRVTQYDPSAYLFVEEEPYEAYLSSEDEILKELHEDGAGWVAADLSKVDKAVKGLLSRETDPDDFDHEIIRALVAAARSKLTAKKHRKRPIRFKKKKVRNDVIIVNGKEVKLPTSYEQAMSPGYKELFEPAIIEELKSIYANNTFGKRLKELPSNKTSALGLRWVFDVKRRADGSIERYKARLVAQGFTQRPGEDYHETFAPVATRESIRLLFSLAATYNLQTFCGDFKTAFLNGEMKEDVYAKWIDGLPGERGDVFKLQKTLYGTKQAARAWFEKLDKALKRIGYMPTTADPCLYIKRHANQEDKFTIVAVYVDDIFGVGTDTPEIKKLQEALEEFFVYKDLGDMKQVLGMKVVRTKEGHYHVSNPKAIHKLVKQYKMENVKAKSTPAAATVRVVKRPTDKTTKKLQSKYRQLVGSLLHLSTTCRPEITSAVQDLGRVLNCPMPSHWKAAIHCLLYLKGTPDKGMTYYCPGKIRRTEIRPKLFGYADANWAQDDDDRKSVSGLLFQLHDSSYASRRPIGNTIMYRSKKQSCVTLSSTEAEYYALGECTAQLIWLRRLLAELGFEQTEPTVIYQDNQACIRLATTEMISSRSRHIDVKAHFTRNAVNMGILQLQFVPTSSMRADIFTKNVSSAIFVPISHQIGMREATDFDQ
jgi:hypothetical protein